jgi:hypothetical protein
MLARERTTAVCVIRIEPQATGVLISVITNRDINSATAQTTRHFSDAGAATSAVAAFLALVAGE